MAGAATQQRAAFSVTLTGTLTKTWSVAETVEGDCDRVTTMAGRWQARLSTARPSRVVALAPTGSRPMVRFAPGVVGSIAGDAARTGLTKVEMRGARCTRAVEQRKCRRSAARSVAGPRESRARVARGHGSAALPPSRARAAAGACSEPSEVRSITTDVNLADAPLDAADVFARDVPRFFISGDTVQVTTLEGGLEGTVTERVRWTLTFTRLAR